MNSSIPAELVLAPIRGITDCVYRSAYARWFPGFDRAIAPFVQPRQGHSLRPSERRQLAPENNRELRVVPQVLTHQASTFVAALRELQDLGYVEANWNLGCPSRTVAGRGRGAGLLPYPERIGAILDAVLSACDISLSVKLRPGMVSSEELPPVLQVLNGYPLAEVILHPRTAAQMYEGELNMLCVWEARKICRHPLVLSGGIASLSDYTMFARELPEMKTWMIGRGALSNPFLPSRIKGTDGFCAENLRAPLVGFHNELLAGYTEWLSGSAHLLSKMKEHWTYLADSFAFTKRVARRIRSARTIDSFTEATMWAFDQPLVDIRRQTRISE